MQRNLNRLLLGLGLAFVIGLAAQSSAFAAQKSCMRDADCDKVSFCEFAAGVCPTPDSGTKGTCIAKPETCSRHYDPVCGCDGKTYGNDCTRRMAGVSLKATGACPEMPANQAGGTCDGIGGQPPS